MQAELSKPQMQLVTTNAQFPAFVGGFGSGKTQALIIRALMLKSKYPSNNIAYYMPTFDLVRTIAFPRFEELLDNMNARYKSVKGLTPKICILNGGEIIFRTMDTPSRIIGYEVADSFVDELDTLKTEDAKDVWTKILSRNRQKKPDGSRNTISVGTTPEGFRFVYRQWKKNKNAEKDGYELIKASTYSNLRNLPADYIENMQKNYPPGMIDAYVNGEFCNLKQGTVYSSYDRKLNASSEVILENEPLHIGMDFNIGKMAAVIFVLRKNIPHAIDELHDIFDTPSMIGILKNKYSKHFISIYPDASGDSRKSTASSMTDIAMLRSAGYSVCALKANPPIRNRVLAMNVMLCSGDGKRGMFVNAENCPTFADALEQQSYDEKTGEPDKKTGLDHILDAAGYFIHYRYPIAERMQFVRITGV